MQLNSAARHINPGTCSGVQLLHCLVIQGLRVPYLRLCRCDPGVRRYDTEVPVPHDERDDVEGVVVAQLGGFLRSSRGAEVLDGFKAEQNLARTRLGRTETEGPNNLGDLRDFDTLCRGADLGDGFRGARNNLGQKSAQGAKPLPASNACILCRLNLGEVIAKRHGDGIAQ
jgi:hypothetical protein